MRRLYRNHNHKVTMPLEVEHRGICIEYEVECEISPYVPAKTHGPPENCYPAEGGEVEVKEVYYVEVQRCRTCAATGYITIGDDKKLCHDCKGFKKTETRHRRPELDCLVSDEEVLEHAAEDGPDYDDMDD